MKIQNAFRLGLFGALGVLVAVVIGGGIAALATIITYIGAAFFLALGIDPLVSWLEKHGWKRSLATLVVLVGVLGVVAAFVLAIIPVIVEQVSNLIEQAPAVINAVLSGQVETWWDANIPWFTYHEALAKVTGFFNDNVQGITGGVVGTVLGVVSGGFGVVIVLILMLYFVTSLGSIKRGLYQLVPATKRESFVGIAEQIMTSVGRYVVGQVVMGLTNGILSAIFFFILGLILGKPIEYAALLAFIAGLFSLIPLVGTITGSTIITLAVWAFDGWPAVLVVAIYYLIYMQIEAYVISPNVMNRAVKVPGVVVVVAALAGGTLLGILGALVAIPVAAAILLIIKQVVIPRQNEL
ncbi:MAG: AI-2E family transporter [Pseudolysinimonas sp.]